MNRLIITELICGLIGLFAGTGKKPDTAVRPNRPQQLKIWKDQRDLLFTPTLHKQQDEG